MKGAILDRIAKLEGKISNQPFPRFNIAGDVKQHYEFIAYGLTGLKNFINNESDITSATNEIVTKLSFLEEYFTFLGKASSVYPNVRYSKDEE